MAEVKKLSDEQQKKIKELRAQALEKMASNADNQTAELAQLYGKLQDLPYTNRVERQKLYREVAAKLGEVPYIDDKPDPAANSYSASGGTMMMHGLLCELRWGNFVDPQGLVTCTKWLCDKGCLQMKYDLNGGAHQLSPHQPVTDVTW